MKDDTVWAEEAGVQVSVKPQAGLVTLSITSPDGVVHATLGRWRWDRLVRTCALPAPDAVAAEPVAWRVELNGKWVYAEKYNDTWWDHTVEALYAPPPEAAHPPAPESAPRPSAVTLETTAGCGWDFIHGEQKPNPAAHPVGSKLITINGHTREIQGADLDDMQVAGAIRMLFRDQLNHEALCTLARDRIVYLADQLRIALANAAKAGDVRQGEIEAWLRAASPVGMETDEAERLETSHMYRKHSRIQRLLRDFSRLTTSQ